MEKAILKKTGLVRNAGGFPVGGRSPSLPEAGGPSMGRNGEKPGIWGGKNGGIGFITLKNVPRSVSEILRMEEETRQRQAEIEREKQEAQAREEARILGATNMELPLDWENAFSDDARAKNVHTESIPDALIVSINTLGRVDIEFISAITEASPKEVILALKGSIYQNPETWGECFYRGWETAEEYLSGNLYRKRKAAEAANVRYKGYFAENLAALDRALTPAVSAGEIYVTLGSPWVPADIIDDFITYILDLHGVGTRRPYHGVLHDTLTGSWEIPHKGNYRERILSQNVYGTLRLSALDILERTLNMRSVSVTDEIDCPTSKNGKRRVVNASETVLALEKQKKILETFGKWVWQDRTRRERLEQIFEERYGCVRRRFFDGTFLDFPTMNKSVTLYPYQKDAVARIIFSPNTLLAHDVGAGKTYVMIAAGMELLRMGLSEKNFYVVPNNLVAQWVSIWRQMYPDADLLTVEPKDFTPRKKQATLVRMQREKHDGVIIAYSCFDRIPLSKKCRVERLKAQIAEVTARMQQDGTTTGALERRKRDLEEELERVRDEEEEAGICFDSMNVDRLFVDEAHNYKNVPIETKITSTLGIGGAGSKRCRDMMEKVRYVQRRGGGKGVVMATGTPITNSVTDAFVMQLYLQSGELAMLELENFDSWIGMFAERETQFEIDVDTSDYRLATRFSKFHNLPELTALLSSVADFHEADGAGAPDHDGYLDVVIPRTAEFAGYLQKISKRADLVRSGKADRRSDNMLKITTDGRKAALDYRLVDGKAGFTLSSKVAQCAENVASVYFRSASFRGTQLVFCDISTPKEGFHLYGELRRLLVLRGIKDEEIAYIHDAVTDEERESLFARVRAGEVRVLIGSTFKLGLGVNVQDRLIALHHLDVPWRPADMVQREGRILRQGNRNPRVYIYRYITEGSFDAYSWQLLETKARFIADLLSGSLKERSGSDVDDVVLDYAEVKALAVGNPLIKERVETANELTRLYTLRRKTAEARLRLGQELAELPRLRAEREGLVAACADDLAYYEAWKEEHLADGGGKEEIDERRDTRDLLREGFALDPMIDELEICRYRGFLLIRPAGFPEKPYLIVKRTGRYIVELGETESGYLSRVDRCLDTLARQKQIFEEQLEALDERERGIRNELQRGTDYDERISEVKSRLEELDKKLKENKK